MNRAYKLVWKISNSTWAVASEFASGGRGVGCSSIKLTSLQGGVATALLLFGMSDALAFQYVVADGQYHDINGGIYTGVPGGGPSKSAVSASGQGTTVDANDVAAEMHESSEYANYWAVSAGNGGTVNLVDSLVEATGVFAGGVQAFGQDSVSTVRGGSIITSGNGGLGVSASSGGSIQLGGVDIRTAGGVASGAVDGQASHAIKAWGDAGVNGSDLTIHTQGNNARGIFAQSHSSGNWAEISLQRSSIVTDGEKAHGVSAEGFSTIALEDSEVLTNGKGAHALYLSGNHSSASLARSKLYASNYYGIGALIDGGWMRAVETEINALSTGLKATDQARVELTDVSVTTRGDFASALDVRGDVASPLDVEGGSSVHAVGLEINALGAAHSHGIYMNGSNVLAEDGSIRTSGSESHGVNIEGWGAGRLK